MGPMDLSKALEVSCDTFFYQLGDDFYGRGGNQFQADRQFGYGTAPPLDAGGAQAGVVPDAVWKASQRWLERRSSRRSRAVGARRRHEHSIGQGNLFLAAAPAGGRLQRARERRQCSSPRASSVASSSRSTRRGPRREHAREAVQHMNLSPTLLGEIKAGLSGAAHAGDGTSGHLRQLPAHRVRQDRDGRGARPPPARTRRRVVGGVGVAGQPLGSSSSHSSTTAATAASRPHRPPGGVVQAFFAPHRRYLVDAGGPVAMPTYLRHLDYLMLTTASSRSRPSACGSRPSRATTPATTSTATSCSTWPSGRWGCSSSPPCRRGFMLADALAALRRVLVT